MSLMTVFWFFSIGVIAGAIAGNFTRGGGIGFGGNLITGILFSGLTGWFLLEAGVAASIGLFSTITIMLVVSIIFLFLISVAKEAVAPYTSRGATTLVNRARKVQPAFLSSQTTSALIKFARERIFPMP